MAAWTAKQQALAAALALARAQPAAGERPGPASELKLARVRLAMAPRGRLGLAPVPRSVPERAPPLIQPPSWRRTRTTGRLGFDLAAQAELRRQRQLL